MTSYRLFALCLGAFALLILQVEVAHSTRSKYFQEQDTSFNAVASKSISMGCRKKVVGSTVLLGGVRACQSAKPLKPSGILKMGKLLCSAEGWGICSHKDRFVDQLSWKSDKLPAGCFAFRYGKKDKAAGYGKDCHTNLYFHGVLCCPQHDNKLVYQKPRHFSKTNEAF